MVPTWLTTLSIIMLSLGGICALVIALDLVLGHRQHMWIMNIVWPVSALFGTFLSVWAYFRYGRLASHRNVMEAQARGEEPPNKRLTPFPVMVGKGAAHCGSGCTLGDICAESIALTWPVVLTWVGWKSLFPATHAGKMFAGWVLDFAFAFLIGVAFQYFTIVPMRKLPPGKGLIEAIKADALSLTAWQVGMYGAKAIAQFLIFSPLWHQDLKADMPEFWFVMQIAMLAGFATSYPVNWWLIRQGIKEKM
ncbi:MAG: DUF4396 domain-containing protein [Aureliella sp.]